MKMISYVVNGQQSMVGDRQATEEEAREIATETGGTLERMTITIDRVVLSTVKTIVMILALLTCSTALAQDPPPPTIGDYTCEDNTSMQDMLDRALAQLEINIDAAYDRLYASWEVRTVAYAAWLSDPSNTEKQLKYQAALAAVVVIENEIEETKYVREFARLWKSLLQAQFIEKGC